MIIACRLEVPIIELDRWRSRQWNGAKYQHVAPILIAPSTQYLLYAQLSSTSLPELL